MNATFGISIFPSIADIGNAVELIISIIALIQGKITIVQASLLGSMLSNLLLVLGMCFFFGGLKHKEQEFNTTVCLHIAQQLKADCPNRVFLTRTCDLIIVDPRRFPRRIGNNNCLYDWGSSHQSRNRCYLASSLCHVCFPDVHLLTLRYLYFQLKSHSYLYDEIAAEETEAVKEYATITPAYAIGL